MDIPGSTAAPHSNEAAAVRFRTALAGIDAANAADPNAEATPGGPRPGALLYGERMTACLLAFLPQASEALQLAVRAQHLERWKLARSAFPEGRKGYHAWRFEQARQHAERAGAILHAAGYDPSFITRVQALLRKERLKLDAEAQALEDVACLVFLEHYFAPFAAKHDEAKILDILRKTWRKMSPAGQAAALKLSLQPESLALVQKALAP